VIFVLAKLIQLICKKLKLKGGFAGFGFTVRCGTAIISDALKLKEEFYNGTECISQAVYSNSFGGFRGRIVWDIGFKFSG